MARKYLSGLAAFLAAAFCFGCAAHKGPLITNATDFLTPEQIALFSEKARSGDGDAAFKLCNYYYFWVYEPATALKWLSLAATNGSPAGAYNLGSYYMEKDNATPTDLKNAKYWLGRLAAQGDTDAINKLRELDQRMK